MDGIYEKSTFFSVASPAYSRAVYYIQQIMCFPVLVVTRPENRVVVLGVPRGLGEC